MPGENVFDTDPGRLSGIDESGDVDDAWIADRVADEVQAADNLEIPPFLDVDADVDADVTDRTVLVDRDGIITPFPRFEPHLDLLVVGADPFI